MDCKQTRFSTSAGLDQDVLYMMRVCGAARMSGSGESRRMECRAVCYSWDNQQD